MARVDTDETEAEGTVETDATEATENTSINEDNSNTDDSATATTAEQSTEAPTEAAPEAPAEPAGPTEAEITALVKEFTDAVEEVVNDTEGGRDESTGTLSVKLVDKVKVAYAKLPAGKVRKGVKDYLGEKMRTTMDEAMKNDMDPVRFSRARSYLQLQDEATAAAKSTAATVVKEPVDPTEALIERVLPMFLAPAAVEVGEGVATDWEQRVVERAQSLQGEIATYAAHLDALAKLAEGAEAPAEPEVNDAVKQAFRIARGRSVSIKKAGKSSGTPGTRAPRAPGAGRGNIGSHIEQAFANVEPGKFLLIAEIANFDSVGAGYDSTTRPSPGAIAARLFDKAGQPKTTIDGIVPGFEQDGNASTKKGARKA